MMKTRHKGKMLTLGSCIGIVAPASACENFDYTTGIELLHKWGYKTKLSKTLKINDGYLAGSDDIRASELNAFLPMMMLTPFYVLVAVMVVLVF